jgi:hypothetical protein
MPTREPRCTVHFIGGVAALLDDCLKDMFSASTLSLAPLSPLQ